MEKKSLCNHAEVDAKYSYIQENLQGKPVTIRVYSWTCKECGERGVETADQYKMCG